MAVLSPTLPILGPHCAIRLRDTVATAGGEAPEAVFFVCSFDGSHRMLTAAHWPGACEGCDCGPHAISDLAAERPR